MQTVEGEGSPTSANMPVGREHPIAEVQSSSAQAPGIGPTGLSDGDGDGIEIEIGTGTGIQWKRNRERNKDKGKGKTEIALSSEGPDFEKVLLPEVPCEIGRSWSESSVA
jgi:hypothetical protein